MTVDSKAFCDGMRLLGGAVNIITAHSDGQSFGLTATAVCSVTAKPPRLLACVNREGATYQSIEKSGKFAVNTLGREHVKLAECFAGISGNAENDRFHIGDWGDVDGGPILKDALVSFKCDVLEIKNMGTHGVIIASINAVKTNKSEPLFYIDGVFVTSTEI